MDCPVCGGKSKVVISRKDCESVVRLRKCIECNYVFYTEELEVDSKIFSSVERQYKIELKNRQD